MLPVIAYGCALYLQGFDIGRNIEKNGIYIIMLGLSLFIVSSVSLIPEALDSHIGVFRGYFMGSSRLQESAAQEVREILINNPDQNIAMGYSNSNGYILTYLRPLIVYQGNPYFIDAGVLMD